MTSGTREGHDIGIPISEVGRFDKTILSGSRAARDRIAREVVARLRASYENSVYEREHEWIRNILFTYDEQWVYWNPYAGASGRWLHRRVSRDRRTQDNVIAARVQNAVAALSQTRPAFQVSPKNPDLIARKTAAVGNRVLLDDWHALGLGRARDLALHDSVILGTGIIEIGYDPVGGRLLKFFKKERMEDGNPMRDEQGQEVFVEEQGGQNKGRPIIDTMEWTGKLVARCLSPFSLFEPPGLEDCSLDEAPWVIRVTFMSEGQIRQRWKLPPDFQFGAPDSKFAEIEQMSAYIGRFSQQFQQPDRHRTGNHLVVQYFERATDVKGYEYGKVITVVNDQFVGEESSQFEDGRYPFYLFPYMPKRGRFWARGMVTPLCDPQKRRNQATSEIQTHLALTCRPNILDPIGSQVPETLAFNFKKVRYNQAAGKPEFMVAPQPNPGIYEVLNRQSQTMDEVSSSFAFSRGQPVPNVPSAEYARMMAEKDATNMGPMIREHARSWMALGGALLELHRLYDTEERMLTVVGATNEAQLRAFSGSDLEADMRVYVLETSIQFFSGVARQQEVQTLAQTGLLGDIMQDSTKRRALREYLHLPELIDIESGESRMDKLIERVFDRLTDQGIDWEDAVGPRWEVMRSVMPIVMAFKEGLLYRIAAEDVDAWNAETSGRVGQFYLEIEKALAELQQQEQQAQQAQLELQLQMAKSAQDIEDAGKIKQATTKEAAKAVFEIHKGAASEVLDNSPAMPHRDNGGSNGSSSNRSKPESGNKPDTRSGGGSPRNPGAGG